MQRHTGWRPGTLSSAAEGGAAERSDQEAPLGPGRPPRVKIYGALVAAKNRALQFAFSMPGVNCPETAPGHLGSASAASQAIPRLGGAAGDHAGEDGSSGTYCLAAGDASRGAPHDPAESHHLRRRPRLSGPGAGPAGQARASRPSRTPGRPGRACGRPRPSRRPARLARGVDGPGHGRHRRLARNHPIWVMPIHHRVLDAGSLDHGRLGTAGGAW